MQLNITKKCEVIEVSGTDLKWEVATDDASIEKMLNVIRNSIIRAKTLSDLQEAAADETEATSITDEVVALQRRVISAVIGAQGYKEILSYIGDGTPVDPREHTVSIGDVMAALSVFVHQKCASKQIQDADAYFSSQAVRPNRAERRKKGKK